MLVGGNMAAPVDESEFSAGGLPHCAADFALWHVEFLWFQAAENKDSSPAPSYWPACIYSATQNSVGAT